MRIVDAENIKDIICRITNDAIEKNQTKATIQKRLIMAVEKMPTLDVRKNTKGEWMKSEIKNEKYVCSECGGACWYYDIQGMVARSRFCPNCGARMKEVSE